MPTAATSLITTTSLTITTSLKITILLIAAMPLRTIILK
jgi:hypothetical protein